MSRQKHQMIINYQTCPANGEKVVKVMVIKQTQKEENSYLSIAW
jgi:hypothetical protein